jgi:Zn-dependent protease
MFRSWRLGKAFGIPLFVHPTFLLVLPWVLYQSRDHGLFSAFFALAVVLTVFGCVVLHELGHALMARYFNIRTRDITLYPIGGVARLDRLTEKPHEELLIALAGPAVNVLIATLLLPVLVLAYGAGLPFRDPEAVTLADGPLTVLAGYASWVFASNVFLVLFNLIPAFPMDGGRVLRALLAGPLGQVRATDIAGRLGLVLAMGMAVLAFVISAPLLFLVSLFVALVGHQERLMVRYREVQRRRSAASEPVVTVAPGGYPGVARDGHPEREPDYAARPLQHGFSGFAWDGHYRVWVRWVDGRPVGYYTPVE